MGTVEAATNPAVETTQEVATETLQAEETTEADLDNEETDQAAEPLMKK